jgi:hypothetical protein
MIVRLGEPQHNLKLSAGVFGLERRWGGSWGLDRGGTVPRDPGRLQGPPARAQSRLGDLPLTAKLFPDGKALLVVNAGQACRPCK